MNWSAAGETHSFSSACSSFANSRKVVDLPVPVSPVSSIICALYPCCPHWAMLLSSTSCTFNIFFLFTASSATDLGEYLLNHSFSLLTFWSVLPDGLVFVRFALCCWVAEPTNSSKDDEIHDNLLYTATNDKLALCHILVEFSHFLALILLIWSWLNVFYICLFYTDTFDFYFQV